MISLVRHHLIWGTFARALHYLSFLTFNISRGVTYLSTRLHDIKCSKFFRCFILSLPNEIEFILFCLLGLKVFCLAPLGFKTEFHTELIYNLRAKYFISENSFLISGYDRSALITEFCLWNSFILVRIQICTHFCKMVGKFHWN